MDEACDEDRQELIRRLASRRTRRAEFSRERPTTWHPTSLRDPATREPFTPDNCWGFIAAAIEAGAVIEVIVLRLPPGKRGFVLKLPGCDGMTIYVKLQLLSDIVLGRSFHESCVDEDKDD